MGIKAAGLPVIPHAVGVNNKKILNPLDIIQQNHNFNLKV